MTICERIVLLRENKGWTQRELATKSNINVSVLNRIENGERELRATEIVTLAIILNVSTDYLLGMNETNVETVLVQHEQLAKLSRNELDKLWKIWKVINE